MILSAILVSLLHGTGAAPTRADSLAVALPLETEVVELEVGDRSVAGSLLKPFDCKWVSSGLGDQRLISEVTRVERVDGKRCYVRDQLFPTGNPGIDMRNRVVLEASTLETLSMEREIMGLPEGADVGDLPTFTRWEFDGAAWERTARIGGQEVTAQGALEMPMFNGSALGLVIAALPLKQDYEARLPVAMALGQDLEWTRYIVHARVVGQESFTQKKNRTVKAWIVAVDWLDFDTGEVTSEGGADQPGGAYFVVPKPPKGFPHVPRYANQGGVIDLYTED